eukprot:4771218-Pyramimonas_sp.AAC.1
MAMFQPGSKLISSVGKIKAHLSPQESGISERERWLRLGSEAADAAAKAGAKLHPQPSEKEVSALFFCIGVSKA